MSLSAQTTVFELVANLWQFLSTSPASIILIKKDLGKCHRFATGSNFKKTQSPPLSSVHKAPSNEKKKRGKMIGLLFDLIQFESDKRQRRVIKAQQEQELKKRKEQEEEKSKNDK
jgi:hypothetical protein